jgi:YidC/Oxa1 family membrane protein insertase
MQFFKDIFFTILYQPFFNILFLLAYLIPGHSIGWAIILMTIIIRALLIPSTNKMLDHQRQIREIQPKIDELKRIHADDQAAQQKATMELYAAEGVSPFGSCLASIVQIPVLLVLYQVFTAGLTGGHESILYSFIPDFTVSTQWFGLDMTKPERWVLPVIVAVLQYIQFRQTSAVSQSTGDKKSDDMTQMVTKNMGLILPIVMWSVARNFPAALALYYATFSLFLITHQAIYLRRPYKPAKAKTKAIEKTGEAPKEHTATSKAAAPKSVSSKQGDVTVTVRKRGEKEGA